VGKSTAVAHAGALRELIVELRPLLVHWGSGSSSTGSSASPSYKSRGFSPCDRADTGTQTNHTDGT
jgi:hypothetical protein